MTTYDIEFTDPAISRCECCGARRVRLTRFVTRNGSAFAVYYASYSNNHPEQELAMLISLGDWSDEADPSRRSAFLCRVRATDPYEVMLGDASTSLWSNVSVMGRLLTREEARAHSDKATAFAVLDEAMLRDACLKGFQHRVRCGNAAEPLEYTFGLPDDVHARGEGREDRAAVDRNFVSLDGKRYFVRCLLPLQVEGYSPWSIGLWVEVSSIDFARVRLAWDDEQAYPELQFSGTLANDVDAALNLSVPIGERVTVVVDAPDKLPSVTPGETGCVADAMRRVWPKGDFETFAIGRGFL
jgi:hypothetical protein